ncbi:hypothetical protein BDQ17DRAFT_1359106 [Cyathus striatus]|nr:hypothetical protein BDQ17DRAFT_1359106 [Cyathus striatus]
MVDVRLLFGPMLIGSFVNAILYGILVVQMYDYYRIYKNDSTRTRLLVLFIFIAETVNTGFVISMMFQPLILKFGLDDAAKHFPTMLTAEPLMIVLISTPIQLFISYRLYRISGSPYVSVIICLLAICSFGGGIWTSAMIVIIRDFARKPELHTPALVWLVTAAAADILITGSISWSLYKRRTGYKQTDAVITRIIILTVQTGLITAVAAMADVIFFLILPKITVNFICDLALTKLYANSLMSTLNARLSLNNRLNQDNVLFDEASPSRWFPPTSAGTERFPTISRAAPDGIYELEGQKGYHTSQGSVEVGIAVTTIVERRTDPPVSPSSSSA